MPVGTSAAEVCVLESCFLVRTNVLCTGILCAFIDLIKHVFKHKLICLSVLCATQDDLVALKASLFHSPALWTALHEVQPCSFQPRF